MLLETNCSLPYLQPPPVQEILSLSVLLYINAVPDTVRLRSWTALGLHSGDEKGTVKYIWWLGG